jgi:hypothetical protein
VIVALCFTTNVTVLGILRAVATSVFVETTNVRCLAASTASAKDEKASAGISAFRRSLTTAIEVSLVSTCIRGKVQVGVTGIGEPAGISAKMK